MPRSTINFDTVRKIGLALPGVEEEAEFGLASDENFLTTSVVSQISSHNRGHMSLTKNSGRFAGLLYQFSASGHVQQHLQRHLVPGRRRVERASAVAR
jgi:hypothetical protein